MPEARVIPLRPDDDEPRVPPPSSASWEEQVAGGLEFLRRRVTGDYDTDEFGFDSDLTDHVLLPLLRPLFSRWFRVETHGVENVPDTGDRKSTRLNSSHANISYAVFCLKKKKKIFNLDENNK